MVMPHHLTTHGLKRKKRMKWYSTGNPQMYEEFLFLLLVVYI